MDGWMDARLEMLGMMEGRSVSMDGVEAGQDPSVALGLSGVDWIRMTTCDPCLLLQIGRRGEWPCGEEGEYGSFPAIICCRVSDQDKNPQMALS